MRKRRIKKRRLVVLILVLVLIQAGLVYWGVQTTKTNRKEELTVIEHQRQKTLDEIENWQNTRNLDAEAFDALKAAAKSDNANAYEGIEETKNKNWISKEDLARYTKLDPATDGLRYKKLYDDQELADDYLVFLSRDTDRLPFVEKYHTLNGHTPEPGNLTESLDSMPHLLQWDERWGYLPYGSSNIVFAGCAPTSLAMIFSYLNQDPSITPYALAKFSQDNGYFVDGVGTSHALLDAAASQYGIHIESIPISEASFDETLSQGKTLLLSVAPGHFTRVGHFIVVNALENGEYHVLDPNSNKNTRNWDKNTVLSETSYAWAVYK
ncbi:C39 family peptidase [Dubosiella newyorkensis]|uniref:Peptidase C39-like domain-containing protein n=1 Tax=Dubosiella newyorkensis TaxID=1862672 RepID=A0A1U7NMM9_9FIRM|nr:C39 family peptidase [Dubosiella newyorkensis]OLU46486.1 hypothetical protein BO225_06140 [Dubosiella newyorkensis]